MDEETARELFQQLVDEASTLVNAPAEAQAALDQVYIARDGALAAISDAVADGITTAAGGPGVVKLAGSPLVHGIFGQSNALGKYNDGPNPASSHVHSWDALTGAWGSSNFALAPWSEAAPNGNLACNNYVLGTAHFLHDRTGLDNYTVMDAWSGTSIAKWIKADNFTGNGAATTFNLTLPLDGAPGSNNVTVTSVTVGGVVKTLGVDYTLTNGIYNTADGTITFTAAPANGAAIVVNYSAPRYASFKAKAEAALASSQMAGKTFLDSLTWAQGEEDFTRPFAWYLDKLNRLHAQLLAESWIDAKKTKRFITGMSGLHDRYEISAALRYFCAKSNGQWRYISTRGEQTSGDAGLGGDFTHFLASSAYSIGYDRIGPAILNAEAFGEELDVGLFYGRASGRATPTDQTAIGTFSSLVNWDSRTEGPGVTDAFVGDGATTAFALTSRGSVSAVTVNGVVKASPADYSIAGTTLTFTAAPANTAAISVAYGSGVTGPAAQGAMSWGFRCYADGNYSFALGYQSYTSNGCNYTMMGGREGVANDSADYSIGWGFQLSLNNTYQAGFGRGHTLASPGEFAAGMFAKYTDGSRLFQYGIGTSGSVRKNALAVAAAGNVEILAPSTATDPGQKEELTFKRVDDTHLKVLLRGADDTVRSANIPLSPAGVDLASGNYVPVVSGQTNCDVLPTVSGARYIQIGNIVYVNGTVAVDATAAGDTLFKVTLPIASNLAATSDLAGTIVAYASSAISGGAIIGSVVDDLAQFRINASSTSARDYTFHFSYEVK